ncbi:MAG: diguanylate cyclase [Treponema sp.]|uniref:diguanylate cyclase domain-containing protein n=1 Tax=Treponema sp. TaxID=166 RepID=UPI001B641170|nr:diguanylate cyclase [Treponema sp.]MBP3772922.1 diguanylate cyclase [Treponema sp.]MBQ9280823.1 diguanylate cyclase [Treponema sp.]
MKKIMIVDDEKISLIMTNHILSSLYATVCASSGDEAIQLFKKERPDMVLSDLRMPGMSGYELQQALEKDFNEGIPFMFMTADTDEETESRGFENGAMDFIHKPFRADVLLKRVGNILQTVEKIQGLKMAAVMDPMTGLLNKSSSENEIAGLCQNASGVLMMIDLDSFKLVNDMYGHDMGDKILIRFAEILKAVVRPIDVVGRLGGDEFIAFCQNVSEDIVIEKKSRFINKYILDAAKEFMGEDMTIPLGASIGCVFVPKEGTDFAALHKKADKALYTVKQNGKHGYMFYTDLSEDGKKEESQSTDLSAVVKILSERNKGRGAFNLGFDQFRTAYQFLSRLNMNYQKEISMLLFTLKEKENAAIPIEDAVDEFMGVLSSSLRQSDIITQGGKNQCIVILPETSLQNVSNVTERIMENWSQADSSAMFSVSFEKGILE